ncbi:hypothetical protein PIB19_17365 [Sphingomonas sp. 7/4-4]|uniref:hypothetical protein n=1 Tax=Sphingomonas sp. 7/4-4 TaxID=3018446 RepID=UPI0022F3CE2E|nr:hypothetical protein [Sphingomonas sp. 7/4-4]WBY07160.1 hypothetical protein PIB19_17365 [Sphingomonas sp. 7/4-4]
MSFLLFLAATPQIVESVDFPALDAAIERCDRASVLPVFAAEAHRRSAAVTAFYEEQVQIAGERIATAGKRRALREEVQHPEADKARRPLPIRNSRCGNWHSTIGSARWTINADWKPCVRRRST